MQEIATGVFGLPLEFEYDGMERTIYPVAITVDGDVILIDTGLPSHVDDLEAELEQAGFDFDDVESIIITHQDSDHAGGLAELVDRTDAQVIAHTDDTPYIDGRQEPIKTRGERYPPVPVDFEVVDGVTFRTDCGRMEVVATPGHTPGHISLYFSETRLLLAADALTAEDGFGGPMEEATPDMAKAISSVDRIASLDVGRTLCYHGGLIEHGPETINGIYDSLQ